MYMCIYIEIYRDIYTYVYRPRTWPLPRSSASGTPRPPERQIKRQRHKQTNHINTTINHITINDKSTQ